MPYKEVHVLLMCWKEDDLECWGEIEGLRNVFKSLYNFHTVTPYQIPSSNPYSAVGIQLHNLVERYSAPDNLLIVYYGGHGRIDDGTLTDRRGSEPFLKMTLAAYR
jgi:hypothetical protein